MFPDVNVYVRDSGYIHAAALLILLLLPYSTAQIGCNHLVKLLDKYGDYTANTFLLK